jgi:NAD(P)-dependent dehydrogenase (short-subunit alcohol dehydrogenase family)
MRLRDKVAVVTGSASGFGRTTAARFAEEGARVLVVDLDAEGGTETVALARGTGSDAELVVTDVSSMEGAEHAMSTAEDRWGGVDILVNNAGIVQGTYRDTWDCDEQTWDRVLEVNLRSVYVCTRAAIPRMVARGGGSIVSVASIAASVCVGGAAYAASKAGILGYTRHISHELAARNIRANCVSPGFMRTPMTTGERAGLGPEEQEKQLDGFAQRVPMKRIGSQLDIAEAILYLASDDSAYVTGQEIVVDGGYVVR